MADVVFGIRLTADKEGFSGEVRLAGEDVQKFGQAANRAAADTTRLDRASDSLARGLDRGRRAVLSLRSAFAALGVGLAVREVLQAALAHERIQNTLRAATGSAEAAGREYAFVAAEAERLGLDLQSAALQFGQLAAAARGTALEGDGARAIFTAVSEAATVMGLSADQTAGALTAIQQIISKGTVSAEELRGQLGERLPGAFQIAARAIGVTTAELGKMLEQGELTAEELLPALARELRETFGPSVAQAVKGAQAELNRFNTTIFRLKVAFAQSGFLRGFTDAMGELRRHLADPGAQQGLRNFGEFVGNTLNFMVQHADTLVRVMGALAGIMAGSRLGLPGAAVGGAAGLFAPELLELLAGGADDAEAKLRALEERIKHTRALLADEQGLMTPAPLGEEERRAVAASLAHMEAQRTAIVQAMVAAAKGRPRVGGGPGELLGDLGGDGGGGGDDDAAEKLREYIAELAFEAEQLQRTARDQAIYNAVRQAGVDINSAAGRTIAELVGGTYDFEQRQKDLNQALDAENDLMEEGRKLVESLRTPFEQYLDDVARAEGLLKAGAIGQETFNRAIDAAGDRYAEQKGLLDEAAESAGTFAEISQEASDVIGTAFEDAVVNVRDWNSALDVGIGLLTDIQRIILRLAVTKPLETALGGLLEGFDFGDMFRQLGFSPGFQNTSTDFHPFHDGGIVGRGTAPTRRLPSGILAGAPRMHGGGWIGGDEQPVIARKGEVIGWPDQMRDAFGGDVKVEVINNTGQQSRTDRTRGADGRELIRVIIGEVATDVASGGQVGRAIAQRFGTGFTPGTLRS